MSQTEILPSYCDAFLRRMEQDHFSSRTKAAYISDVRIFLYYLSALDPENNDNHTAEPSLIFLNTLRAKDIDAFLCWLDEYSVFSPAGAVRFQNRESSKKRKLASLRYFFSSMKDAGLLINNPAMVVRGPRLKSAEAVLLDRSGQDFILMQIKEDKDKAALLISDYRSSHPDSCLPFQIQAGPLFVKRNICLLLLLLQYRISISECAALNLDQFDSDGTLHSVSQFTVQNCTVNSDVTNILRDYLLHIRPCLNPCEKDSSAVFISSRHFRISVRGIEMMVKKYLSPVISENPVLHLSEISAIDADLFYHQLAQLYDF